MLDTIWASAALFAKPDIKFAIDAYERRLKILTSFDYNTTCNPPTNIYYKIIELSTKIDNLKILNNALLSAVKLLKPEQGEIIRLFYFDRMTKELITDKCAITADNYKYKKRTGLKKAAFFLDMLGITNERFITLFNEEPLLIRSCLYAFSLKEKTKHFASTRKKAAAK